MYEKKFIKIHHPALRRGQQHRDRNTMWYTISVLCKQNITLSWLMWKAQVIPEHALVLNITTRPVDHSVKPGRGFNPLKYCYCITVQTSRGTNTNIWIVLAVSCYTMSFSSIRNSKIQLGLGFSWPPSISVAVSYDRILWQSLRFLE